MLDVTVNFGVKGEKMIRIELLSTENFKPDSLDNYQRKQDVKKVYRKHNGEYILVDCVYIEDWDMEKRRFVAKDISSDDSIAYLAIENDEVVGFIGLKKRFGRVIYDFRYDACIGCLQRTGDWQKTV